MTRQARLENVADVYPLSPVQRGMLFHSIADPDPTVYVTQITTELRGRLDRPAFKAAWSDLVARHPLLRTAFLWDGLDEPLQVVREAAELEWYEASWDGLPPPEQRRCLDALLEEDRRRGFDLAAAPLSRMAIIRTGPRSWQWVWTLHHLVADGWAAQVVVDELLALYRARVEGTPSALPPPSNYREFVEQYLGRDDAAGERFWRDRLTGFRHPHRLGVPGLPPAPAATGSTMHTVRLSPATTAGLRGLATDSRVTLNTVVVGAWALLLSRWVRERDVVFGVTTAGRSADLPGVERGVGPFINTLPARIDVAPHRELRSWLGDIQSRQHAALEHEHSSLADVHRWSDVPAGEALFESIFVFENYPAAAAQAEAGDLEVGDVRITERSHYPLAVLVVPGDALSITLVTDDSRFAPEAAARLGDAMVALLDEFPGQPDSRLSSFSTVGPEERLRLQDLGAGPDAEADDRCVHEVIADVTRRRPGATAVVFEGRSITYGELEQAADGVAARLRAAGAAPNRPIGLYLPRSIEMIVAMLGILRAGGAYVPLDPSYPTERIARLLEGDAIDLVVTDAARRRSVPGSTTVVLVDDPEPAPPSGEPANVTAEDLAYVIHTSGSTGRPKGVMVSHRSLVRSTLARGVHYGGAVGRFLLLSSFAFDSSVVGIFWTLCTGGALVLPSPGLEQDADALLELAGEAQVTHLLCLPALYQALLEAERGRLASLAVGIVAGEACPPGLFDLHRDRVPGAELHNEYGPTEATVWCTVHRATNADLGKPLPIGRPIAGTRIHLLDQDGHAVPKGLAGELCVAGPNLAAGYLNSPDLTAERFVTIEAGGSAERVYRTGDLACFRPDGTLDFLGRADQQLKIRGHRVEAGAVEAALRSHPAVRDAAAAGVREPGRAAARLIAFVQPASGAVDVAELRRGLEAQLPAFMVPAAVVVLDELPRLPNGKVDYRALPELAAQHAGPPDEIVAPRTDAEKALAAIWADLLGVTEVGVTDDFFALGGDSIVSIQMISRARQAGLHVQPGDVVAHPTIERLAAVAATPAPAPDRGPLVGDVPLGPIQRWFFEAPRPDPGHWNLTRVYRLPRDVDAGALGAAVSACVAHHDMLRARFARDGSGWRQHVEPEVEVRLDVLDVSAPDVDARIREAQAGFDLGRGPLLRARLLRTPDENLLVVAAHHLVVDAVSWAVLTADLESAYRQAAEGEAIELPPRTTSFRDWVDHLVRRDRRAEAASWPAGPPPRLPRDVPGAGAGPEQSTRAVHTGLDAETTRRLLTGIHAAYRTRPEDILVAALADAIAGWLGEDRVWLALEGHGRPDDVAHVDLSRTVGWFTALWPVALEVPRRAADGDLVKAVKEQLRSVPGGGVGYGALRYLDEHAAFAGQPDPDIVFNYLSRSGATAHDALLQPVAVAGDASRDPRGPRGHLLEVIAAVDGDRLTMQWLYSTEVHEAATIEALADRCLASLLRLVDHCSTAGAGGYTPSDFPEAGLDQAELDRFLDSLEP